MTDPQPEQGRVACTAGSFWDEPPLRPWWSWWHVAELGAVFVTGLVVMTFFYGDHEGLPGYDDYYHAKMAVLLPQIGLIHQFKWLTTTIFADRFVSHHWGFQVLLVPFVYAGQWLRGDYMMGAKWGITFFFALSMVLFHLLLMVQRVRFRWLWLGLFLVMPTQFFGRQAFIRAIAPSLACMLGILLLMFRRRYVWCALLIATYVHIYLGAVFYVPLLVGTYFGMGLLGGDRDSVSWKLPAWAALGLVLGVLTHPYLAGMFHFLDIQVLGSGLTPDIPVGREWKSYEGKLWELVFVYFGFPLSLLVGAVVARMRMGERLNAQEATVFTVNLVFLAMAFRQRRFIEYWPPFGLLASAYLLAPLLDRLTHLAADAAQQTRAGRLWWMGLAAAGLLLAAGLYLLLARGRMLGIGPFIAEWPAWAFLAGLVAWVPMLRFWMDVPRMAGMPGQPGGTPGQPGGTPGQPGGTPEQRVARSSGVPARRHGAGPCAGTRDIDHGPGTILSNGSGTVPPGVPPLLITRPAVVGSANLLAGALMLALVFGPVLVAFRGENLPPAQMYVPLWAWIALGLAYAAGGMGLHRPAAMELRGGADPCGPPSEHGSAEGLATGSPSADPCRPIPDMHPTPDTHLGRRHGQARGSLADRGVTLLSAVTRVVTGGAFVLLLVLGGAGQMVDVQRSTRSNFDLPAVRRAMDYLQAHSPQDAIVFTDDWDVFPVYFYHNHHNRYIVGLDPKFSHARDPVLWERYVRITQSKRFPVTAVVDTLAPDGQPRKETVQARLEDIRDYFGASYVITDPDHTLLARNIEAAPELAERVYPPGERKDGRWPPFTIYRIKPGGTTSAPTSGPSAQSSREAETQ